MKLSFPDAFGFFYENRIIFCQGLPLHLEVLGQASILLKFGTDEYRSEVGGCAPNVDRVDQRFIVQSLIRHQLYTSIDLTQGLPHKGYRKRLE